MQVETYECQETRTETPEQSAEALRLIEELGLEGQKPKQNEEQVTTVRNPYRLMRDDEQFVYTQLCPERTSVEKFSSEPIPLEVLKTLAYAKSLGCFAYFEVWSASSAIVKDPVLVAYPGKTSYGSPSGPAHIIARWANELLPLEVLLPDALNKWYLARKQKLLEIKDEVERELNRAYPLAIPQGDRSVPVFYK